MTYQIPEHVRQLSRGARGGWIGVDLDGTMFTYTDWVGWNVFGEPIKPMIDRVLLWLASGVMVKVVTARVGSPIFILDAGSSILKGPYPNEAKINTCHVTGEPFSDVMMIAAIQDHLAKHGIPRLQVQCYKDVNMIELWDDRAIQVIANKGTTLVEEHEAELEALRGKAFQGGSIFDRFNSL
jgi:hypothetical protein